MGVKKWIILISFLMFIITIPRPVSAHTVLLHASPAPNSILSSAPKEVRLEFNERLQNELYSIKVYDDKGSLITKTPTIMSANQRVISITLPQMNAGVYTITYHIISADGHAVNSTFVFTIGIPSNPPNPIALGHNHSDAEAIYSFRIVHYLMFLTLVGWMFWRHFISFNTKSEEQEYRKWLRYFCHFNLFFLIQVILLQSIDSIDDITFPNVMALWTGTSIGISWICTLVLSITAYWVFQQNRWIIGIWIILILVAQTISGHAFAADPLYLTLFLDWIHLMSASIWIGGLLFIMIFFKNHKTLILHFLPLFSKGALLSIIALIFTGTWYALILVPKLEYLLYTGWGLFLIAKICLVIAIIFIASRIRYFMKQQKLQHLSVWLKRDFTIMLGIVAIVGIFTYLSPVPSNRPLDWRFTEGSDQRNVLITPNMPGNNQFTVYLTQPKKNANYKSVALQLISMTHMDIAPIEVPLKLLNQSEISNSFEIEQFTYSADGPYLAFPGKWKVKLIIVDASDSEHIFENEIRNY